MRTRKHLGSTSIYKHFRKIQLIVETINFLLLCITRKFNNFLYERQAMMQKGALPRKGIESEAQT